MTDVLVVPIAEAHIASFPAWAAALAHRGGFGMGVPPEYRGRGIGKRLLEACIAKAWTKGITSSAMKRRNVSDPPPLANSTGSPLAR